MARILVVPIYLDALVLDKPTAVVEAFADFSRLPYFNGERDVNPDVPYISEEILSQPFQNHNLYLERGVHLHWALPDALTRGRREQTGNIEFPAVPNRWLVTRLIKKEIDAQWIVESDYLQSDLPTYLFSLETTFAVELDHRQVSDMLRQQFQENNITLTPMAVEIVLQAGNQWRIVDTDQTYLILHESQALNVYLDCSPDVDLATSVTYPVLMDQNQPFAYLGRVVKLVDWPVKNKAETHYLPKLTAVGYGEPAFAAFYPNCHSVFGFWDLLEPDGNNLQSISYEVLGWYSDSKQDFFTNWINDLENPSDTTYLLEAQLLALKDSNLWEIPALEKQLRDLKKDNPSATLPPGKVFATQMMCYAQIGFEKAPVKSKSNNPTGLNVVIGPPDVALTTSGPVRFPITITGAKSINLGATHITLNKVGSVDVRSISIINGTTSQPTVILNHIIGKGSIGISIASGIARDNDGNPSLFSGPSDATTVDTVSIGNTSTEALSAYLADQLNPSNKKTTEEQLEALDLASGLENRYLDIGPKFKEGRHTKGFRPVPAGSIWTLRPESESPTGQTKGSLEQLTLPVELAELLNTLNEKQQEYDQATFKIESMRYQLFADWYKYMVCAYPPLDTPDHYPNIDEVKRFIEVNDCGPLEQEINKVRTLWFGKEPDAVGQPVLSSDPPGESFAASVVQALNHLLDSDAMSNLQMVVESDILDWSGFLGRLQAFAPLDIPASLSKPLDDPQQKKAQVVAILQQLNALSFSRDFYRVVEKLSNLSEVSKSLIDSLEHPTDLKKHTWLRLNRLLLESLFPEHIAHRPNYILKRMPAPRYWEPNDPIVLLAGNIATPSDRHGSEGELQKEGLLQCQIVPVDDSRIVNSKILNQVRKEIHSQVGTLGYQAWEKQPWQPILLEWEVEFLPSQVGNNLNPHNRTYDKEFIAKNNYVLSENEIDFTNAPETAARAANIYSGRSVLTPHAKIQIKKQLENYLKKDAAGPWHDIAEKVYENLQKTHVLAQALSGFNQALLMRKQTLQFPLRDPLGFDDYQNFTERVSAAVGTANRSAPQPLNDFNPIRAGTMRILRLRLIDTFGQVQDIDCSQVITPETMPMAENGIALSPRLAQPARLNFRWLAADGAPTTKEETEMNDHPATSPICGWILPNHLDGRLMFYEQGGKALGSLGQDGVWQPALEPVPVSISGISNPHLKALITYLSEQNKKDLEASPPKKPSFLEQFMNAIENALENIDPESFAHHEALALLMGRPIAVVRASLNLELRGRAAINQDWNIFRQDMQSTKIITDTQGVPQPVRTTDGFTNVSFPIRIGEFEQLNDGLVGYWVEEREQYANDIFYAPQTSKESNIDHEKIRIHRDDTPAMIQQSIDDLPHKLTMLVDPRGVVHATCGILPAKSIQIPADQFADALRAIEVTFLTAPVLTDIGKVNLPLPDEPGFQWSWLKKENGVWADESDIGKVNTQATFAAKQEIREGWLKLRHKPDGKSS